MPARDIAEVGGDDSWQNLSEAAPVLKDRGATTVLVVTDPFHEHRSLAIATDVGLTAYPTPTQTSPISGIAAVPYFLKETLGVGLGRVIGYQQLHSLEPDGPGRCAPAVAPRLAWSLAHSGVV